MGKSGNTFILLLSFAVTVVGIDFLSTNGFRGPLIILLAVFLAVVGSYYQWIEPKNRSKFWLILPALFTALGYIPLMVLRKRKRIFSRLSRGFENSKSIDSRDSYAMEAAKTTKYYLELTRNYYDRFNDEASLLAAAGLLDAKVASPSFLEGQDYIGKTISQAKIINIAKKSVLAKEEALVDFIINLEIELFNSLYASEFDISEIRESCYEKRRDIACVVQKVKREYAGESDFASDTSSFMESHKFKGFRETLGINELANNIFVSSSKAANLFLSD